MTNAPPYRVSPLIPSGASSAKDVHTLLYMRGEFIFLGTSLDVCTMMCAHVSPKMAQLVVRKVAHKVAQEVFSTFVLIFEWNNQ